MADAYETAATPFTILRLRSTDTAYLPGAVRPVEGVLPSAVAYGPRVNGPSSAVGALERWVLGLTVPSTPELVWVLVSNKYLFLSTSAVSAIAGSYMAPIGDPTDGSATRGPLYSLGDNIERRGPLASAGSNYKYVHYSPDAVADSCWVPLEPEQTVDGFQVNIVTRVGTPNGPGINTARIDAEQIRFVGYPVNLWNTGALWAGTPLRGS